MAIALAQLALPLAEEPDQQTLQRYIADLREDAPLARMTLDYIDHDARATARVEQTSQVSQVSAAQDLIEAYWRALRQQEEQQRADERGALDADAYRLYLDDVMRLGPPMKREQALAAARQGRRPALVEGNLLLVVSIANRWSRLPWRSKLDMIQEGNIGLMRAAEKFSDERGASFAHYAYFWIERYVREEAKRQDIPSGILPYTERVTLDALRRQQTLLRQQLGRELTLTETVAHLHATHTPTPSILKRRTTWPTVEEVQEWLAASEITYLSALSGEGDDDARASSSGRLSLGDLLADRRASLDEQLALNELERLPQSARSADSHGPHDPCGLTTRGAQPNHHTLARVLGVLWRERVLTEADVTLIVLHLGVAHPAPDWRPPAGWRLGCYHGFRQMAQFTGKARTTLQHHYNRLILRIGADEHPALRALGEELERHAAAQRR